MPKPLTADQPFKKWCTHGGGFMSILVVAGAIAVIMLVAYAVAAGLKQVAATWYLVNVDAWRVALVLVCVLLALLLLEAPIYTYVTRGQAKRIALIKSYFSASVIARYLDQFWSGRDGIGDLVKKWKDWAKTVDPNSPEAMDATLRDALHEKFDGILQEDFGLNIYIFPAIVLTGTAVIVLSFGFYGGMLLALNLSKAPGLVNPFGIQIDLVSVAAIFGAYTWITSDAITRNYQGALHASDLYWYALRLVVAVPLGQAVSMIVVGDKILVVNADSGAFLAFVISMFSFERISQILSAVASKATGYQLGTPAEREDLVIKLPGVDEATSNRLAAEGITTVAQMAAADPIRVSIRASLAFDFALELIDAALLWRYVGGKVDVLRKYGFKGVSSILNYRDEVIAKERPVDDLVLVYQDASRAYVDAQKRIDAWTQSLVERQAGVALRVSARDAALNARMRASEAKLNADVAAQAGATDPNLPTLQAAALAAQQASDAASTAATLADANLQVAKDLLATATTELDAVQKSLDQFRQPLADARAALIGVGTLMSDAAQAAELKESGLLNIVQEIVRNEYARFIRRMMWEEVSKKKSKAQARAVAQP